MPLEVQITRIQHKLAKLKSKDVNLKVFGADSHRYQLNPTLKTSQVTDFEREFDVTLPEEYALFLTRIGNGSAGPYYGVVPLEISVRENLDYIEGSETLYPNAPFPYTEAWNIEFNDTNEEEYDALKHDGYYFSLDHINGLLRISNYGCGISINLVVNGQEYGNMWTDDRCNDGGIYPSHELGNTERITFLDWYELWLDKSLAEVEAKVPIQESSKRWWQIWKR